MASIEPAGPPPDGARDARAPFGAVRWRPVRTAWLSSRIWKRRLILLLGAILIGVAATAFAEVADLAAVLHHRLVTAWPWAMLVVAPLGFAAIAALTSLWFNGAQGSGIPQVIAARSSKDHTHRAALLSTRVTLGKIVLTAIGLVIGASIGREGPTVQVGAAVMFAVGGYAGIGRQRGLVLAGAAAGIAGAFNTPLAGVLFAIEELAKSFERRMTAITAASVVLAGMTGAALVGDYSYFGTVWLRFQHVMDWVAVPICAVVGGGLGGLFSRALIDLTRRSRRGIGRSLARRMVFAAACGLGVALIAFATHDYGAGTGYAQTKVVLETGAMLPWYYAPAKLVATLLSSVSGIPGGLFSPSLSVGAGLGSVVTAILPGADPTTVATLAMVGYFSGVVQSPLTAFVIVMEMTASERTSIPLMATSLLAASLSRLISREPLYHALSYGFSDPSRFRGRPNERLRTNAAVATPPEG